MKTNKFHFNTRLLESLTRILGCRHADIVKASGIGAATWYNILNKPQEISVQQLLDVANGLHIPVRYFFGDAILHREEYITEPYQECYYDADHIMDVINRSSITWVEVAKAANKSIPTVRDSLALRRSAPLERLLTICNTFSFDLFKVLIDPNPKQARVSGRSAGNTSAQEVSALQREVEELRAALAAMQEEVAALRQDHNTLARRVSVSINTIHDSYLSIAAEPEPNYGKKKRTPRQV